MNINSLPKKFEALYDVFFRKITLNKYERPNLFSPVYLSNVFIVKSVNKYSNDFRGVLLDLGSGNNPYYHMFKDRISNYITLDYPQKSRVALHKKPNLYADGQKICLRSNSIDTCLCTGVMEYINYPDKLVREINRILKPGGMAYFSVPLLYPVHHDKIDYFRFTRNGIKIILERNGFKVSSILKMGGFWVFVIQMFTHYFSYRLFRNVPGIPLKTIFGILKILFTPALLLFNLIFNLLALLMDKIDIDNTFTLNYFIVSKKSV